MATLSQGPLTVWYSAKGKKVAIDDVRNPQVVADIGLGDEVRGLVPVASFDENLPLGGKFAHRQYITESGWSVVISVIDGTVLLDGVVCQPTQDTVDPESIEWPPKDARYIEQAFTGIVDNETLVCCVTSRLHQCTKPVRDVRFHFGFGSQRSETLVQPAIEDVKPRSDAGYSIVTDRGQLSMPGLSPVRLLIPGSNGVVHFLPKTPGATALPCMWHDRNGQAVKLRSIWPERNTALMHYFGEPDELPAGEEQIIARF